MSSPEPINVGIVGYGLSAKVFHIPLIQHVASLRLAAVLQRSPKSGNDVTADHPDVRHYSDLAGLLADKEVELLVITSTPESHHEIAAAALDAGKNVVVEKPFAPTASECEDLVQRAKKAGKMLTVFQNRRWDLDFLTLKSLVDAGTLGRIVDFETHFDRFRPGPPRGWKGLPQPGNGGIYDLGSHLVDQVIALFGPPRRVTGFVFSQREGGAAAAAEGRESDDSCTLLLHYPDRGLTATAKVAVISPETEQLRFWVRGSEGSFKKYGVDTQEAAIQAGARPSDPGFGSEPESQWGTLTLVGSDGASAGQLQSRVQPPIDPAPTYAAFYRGVLAALRGGAAPPVDPVQAAQTIRVIELAMRSSKEGRTLDFNGQSNRGEDLGTESV